MKKIVLTVAAILAFGYANAQDQGTTGFAKGDMFVEGAFSIKSGNLSQGSSDVKNSYGFNPRVGYFINDKVAIGAELNLSGNKFYGTNVNGSASTSTFGLGAFARYYFLTLGSDKNFRAYGQAGLGYSGTRGEFPGGATNDADKFNGIKANIDLGMNYFFTKNWAATFTLANILSYNTLNPENGNNTSSLDVNINLFNNIFAQPTFGLLYKW